MLPTTFYAAYSMWLTLCGYLYIDTSFFNSVAGHLATFGMFNHVGPFASAALVRMRAARMKRTTGWRVERIGHFAGDWRALFTGHF